MLTQQVSQGSVCHIFKQWTVALQWQCLFIVIIFSTCQFLPLDAYLCAWQASCQSNLSLAKFLKRLSFGRIVSREFTIITLFYS